MEKYKNAFNPPEMLCASMIGKTFPQGNWLPVWAHCMDTAGVMGYLLREWAAETVQERLSRNISRKEVGRLGTFLALVHDVGKLTPLFQGKIAWQLPRAAQRIEALGIALARPGEFPDPGCSPHELAGEAILLRWGCPPGIAAVVGAHHGAPGRVWSDPEEQLETYAENFYEFMGRDSAQRALWEAGRREWLTFALARSGYGDVRQLPQVDVPMQMLLSGLLIMADWIASNPVYAPLLPQEDAGETLLYPQRSGKIWETLSFPASWRPRTEFFPEPLFRRRFGFSPNRMQLDVLDAVERVSRPGIYILEAPMGWGKTEGALAAAELLASRFGCNGVDIFPFQRAAGTFSCCSKGRRTLQLGETEKIFKIPHCKRRVPGICLESNTTGEYNEGYRTVDIKRRKKNKRVRNSGRREAQISGKERIWNILPCGKPLKNGTFQNGWCRSIVPRDGFMALKSWAPVGESLRKPGSRRTREGQKPFPRLPLPKSKALLFQA